MAENQKTNLATVRFSSGIGNTLQIKFPKVARKEEKCSCSISKPAKSFKELIELVKQAEVILIKNKYTDMEDRISIIRGIYYGTEWSVDYKSEKSAVRNLGFNIYTDSFSKPDDARVALKCCENCKADLYNSFFNSYEIFDGSNAIDFGHLIIGMESRCDWYPTSIKMPATGLEMNTWVGDLGGGTATLSLQRIDNPQKRAKSLFPISGHSYGTMVNLEGDIAAYVVGMDIEKPDKISDPTDKFSTIYESLEDYFNNLWNKRTYYFLRMIGGKFSNNSLINKKDIITYCANAIKDFAYFYLSMRMADKNKGSIKKIYIIY